MVKTFILRAPRTQADTFLGDFANQHFIQPPDTGIIVDMTLAILSKSHHPVSWINFPVPKDRQDEAYLAPHNRLLPKLGPETALYVGLVHGHDLEGTTSRLLAAKEFFRERRSFGVATECGLGRRTKENLESVVKIQRAIYSV